MSSDVLASAWRFADAVRPLFQDVGVVLFGSQAKGTAHPGSDIDIAVLVPEIAGREEDAMAPLRASEMVWEVAMQVDPRIEPHLIECEHDGAAFSNTVMSTGVKLRPNGDAVLPDGTVIEPAGKNAVA